MIRFVLLAGAAALAGSAMDPGLAPAPQASQSCTAKWLARRETLPLSQRYDRATADRFGRQCLGVTGRVPIDWQAVRGDLAELIDDAYPLNSLVPSDIAAFCPTYARASTAERRDFWRELAYQVIKPEAGTNAHALMWEQPRDRAGKPVGGEYSVGLLQLSVSNRGPYGCDIPDEASLLDPRSNLACGVKIMSKLVSRDGRLGGDPGWGRVGLGRYWSTIRVASEKPSASSRRETRQPIIDAVRRLPQCASR